MSTRTRSAPARRPARSFTVSGNTIGSVASSENAPTNWAKLCPSGNATIHDEQTFLNGLVTCFDFRNLHAHHGDHSMQHGTKRAAPAIQKRDRFDCHRTGLPGAVGDRPTGPAPRSRIWHRGPRRGLRGRLNPPPSCRLPIRRTSLGDRAPHGSKIRVGPGAGPGAAPGAAPHVPTRRGSAGPSPGVRP